MEDDHEYSYQKMCVLQMCMLYANCFGHNAVLNKSSAYIVMGISHFCSHAIATYFCDTVLFIGLVYYDFVIAACGHRTRELECNMSV